MSRQDCLPMRELASRLLDGDLPDTGPERAALDAHLQGCPECVAWQEQAVFLRRMTRASRLDPPAGLARSTFAALGARRRRTATWVLAVRAALVGVAVTGCALALPALLWAQDDGLAEHASHEIGSTDVALYAGLLAAAVWPRRARGILAVLGAAALLLAVTALHDVAAGYTTLAHESDHSFAVVGAILVWVLTRLVPENAPPLPLPASALGLTAVLERADDTDSDSDSAARMRRVV